MTSASRRQMRNSSSVLPQVSGCLRKHAFFCFGEFKDVSYEERMKKCGPTTMESRRSRADLMDVYKIIDGKEALQWERFFELAPNKANNNNNNNFRVSNIRVSNRTLIYNV